ncbi:unnamed protein product [Oikopleura dioica]|uniref:Uncharacterized protein n=1 Tax=Oikopleura dioica TaxID=34765 RepID=E4X6N9_OIKDI|nr:unnamed protein product [Oikopleura dioica]
MTVCDILGPGRLQENCYIVLKKYLGIDYGPSGSETPVFGLLFNIMIVMAFIFLGLKNRPKWSKRDFMVRAKLDELDEELKLKVNEALYERVAVSKDGY